MTGSLAIREALPRAQQVCVLHHSLFLGCGGQGPWSAAGPLPERWHLGRLDTEIRSPDRVPVPERGACFLVHPTLRAPAGTREGQCVHGLTCLCCLVASAPRQGCLPQAPDPRTARQRPPCGRRLVSRTPPAWQLLISWGLELNLKLSSGAAEPGAPAPRVPKVWLCIGGSGWSRGRWGRASGATSHVSVWWPHHVQPELSWPPP